MYTIQDLARMAKISVRTLRHYDDTGLLIPVGRNNAGLRLYKKDELLRLQQILFYKKLGLKLLSIKEILDNPNFDIFKALDEHKKNLQQEIVQNRKLIKTIEKTILFIKQPKMLTDEELYEGFSKEQIERYNKEVDEKYDPKVVKESRDRVRRMSKEQLEVIKKEGGDIYSALAELMGKEEYTSQKVQDLIRRHFLHINHFYTVTKEIYSGLAHLYVDNPEFKQFYEKVKPGLAEFLSKGMLYYVENNL